MESDYFHLLLYKYITPSKYMYHIVSYFYRVLCCVFVVFINSCLKILRQKRTNKNVLKQKGKNKEMRARLREEEELVCF